MNKNRLFIAAAGSGKTTYLINEAVRYNKDKVLLTTYTEANEAEIKSKLIAKYKSIPSHITIQTWFSFVIQHGLKPYQGSINEIMFNNSITGLHLVNTKSAIKLDHNGNSIYSHGHPIYWSEEYFQKHYFNSKWQVYSDKLSKLVHKINKISDGLVTKRISRIFSRIYIDEVQDLAGYDLSLIKSLMKTPSELVLVGDPRQVTYLTHHEDKYGKYAEGNIKQFLLDECKSLIKDGIDETTLSVSHRNNSDICTYSSKLYPELVASAACTCNLCRNSNSEHIGIFLVQPANLHSYLETFKPIQLRWNSTVATNPAYKFINFGESKGKTFDRVLIYPTNDMREWIFNNDKILKNETRAKFYVAITRAKHSVAIVTKFDQDLRIEGVQFYQPIN